MSKESRIIQLANYLDINGNNYPYQGRIYSVHGIAPTFPACVGGSTIVTKNSNMEMTDKKTDKEYIEFKEAVIKYAMDKKIFDNGKEDNFYPTRLMLRDNSVKGINHLRDIYERLVERYGYKEATRCPIMRIRKLTPRECFRLMDVDDKYIDAIDAYRFPDDGYEKDCLGKEIINTETGKRQKHRIGTQISDSKKYQLAGNSIVVNCMYHIFDNLFVHPSFSDAVKDGVKIDNNGQLSLF